MPLTAKEKIKVLLDRRGMTLTQLAEYVRYSEYYLSRRFKQEVGMNVKEYIRQKRLSLR